MQNVQTQVYKHTKRWPEIAIGVQQSELGPRSALSHDTGKSRLIDIQLLSYRGPIGFSRFEGCYFVVRVITSRHYFRVAMDAAQSVDANF